MMDRKTIPHIEANMFYGLPHIGKYANENKESILSRKVELEKLTVVADHRYFVLQNLDLLALKMLQRAKNVRAQILTEEEYSVIY